MARRSRGRGVGADGSRINPRQRLVSDRCLDFSNENEGLGPMIPDSSDG